METKIDSRCHCCVALVLADPSLLFTADYGAKDWQIGPDARTHWAPVEGWDRSACGVRVLRRTS